MKYFILIIFLILSFIMLPGCSGNKVAELYETAGFEELQNNREHALRLYKEIIEKYPDTDYAGKAEERISQLRQKLQIRRVVNAGFDSLLLERR